MKTKLLLLALVIPLFAGTRLHAADAYPTKTCIVSGDLYGGDLGPPVKISYKGRPVILCCTACVKKFNRDPEKYMAILDAAQKGKK